MKSKWVIEVVPISTLQMSIRFAAQGLRINLLVSVTTMAPEIKTREEFKIEIMVAELDQGQLPSGVSQTIK